MRTPLILLSLLIVSMSLFLPSIYAKPDPDLMIESDQMIQRVLEYCISHNDQILNGGNPIDDLIKSGLISSSFVGKTCNSILMEQTERSIQEFNREII
jgi:hypothetical protein